MMADTWVVGLLFMELLGELNIRPDDALHLDGEQHTGKQQNAGTK